MHKNSASKTISLIDKRLKFHAKTAFESLLVRPLSPVPLVTGVASKPEVVKEESKVTGTEPLNSTGTKNTVIDDASQGVSTQEFPSPERAEGVLLTEEEVSISDESPTEVYVPPVFTFGPGPVPLLIPMPTPAKVGFKKRELVKPPKDGDFRVCLRTIFMKGEPAAKLLLVWSKNDFSDMKDIHLPPQLSSTAILREAVPEGGIIISYGVREMDYSTLVLPQKFTVRSSNLTETNFITEKSNEVRDELYALAEAYCPLLPKDLVSKEVAERRLYPRGYPFKDSTVLIASSDASVLKGSASVGIGSVIVNIKDPKKSMADAWTVKGLSTNRHIVAIAEATAIGYVAKTIKLNYEPDQVSVIILETDSLVVFNAMRAARSKNPPTKKNDVDLICDEVIKQLSGYFWTLVKVKGHSEVNILNDIADRLSKIASRAERMDIPKDVQDTMLSNLKEDVLSCAEDMKPKVDKAASVYRNHYRKGNLNGLNFRDVLTGHKALPSSTPTNSHTETP